MDERSSRRSAFFSFDDVVALLVPTLGREKSIELVDAAIGRLRLPRGMLDMDQTRHIFDTLSTEKGLVGIAARFVKTRLDNQATRVSSVPSPERSPASRVSVEPAHAHDASVAETPSASRDPEPPRSSRADPTLTRSDDSVSPSDIVALMAPSIGFDHAANVVLEACRTVGMQGEDLTSAQALGVFDLLAEQPGLLGIAARFAKARMLLRTRKPPESPST